MLKRRGGKQRARRPNGGDEDEGLRAGDDVEIHSLQAQPEHNGKAGTLVAFDAESGRWVGGLMTENPTVTSSAFC